MRKEDNGVELKCVYVFEGANYTTADVYTIDLPCKLKVCDSQLVISIHLRNNFLYYTHPEVFVNFCRGKNIAVAIDCLHNK